MTEVPGGPGRPSAPESPALPVRPWETDGEEARQRGANLPAHVFSRSSEEAQPDVDRAENITHPLARISYGAGRPGGAGGTGKTLEEEQERRIHMHSPT
jgi:hypothetical protein